MQGSRRRGRQREVGGCCDIYWPHYFSTSSVCRQSTLEGAASAPAKASVVRLPCPALPPAYSSFCCFFHSPSKRVSRSQQQQQQRSLMAIYQRCQQPTSRKVLLHPLPLPLPACAHLPHDRLHVAIKVSPVAPRAGSCNTEGGATRAQKPKPKANPSATSTMGHGTRCGANEDKRLCQNPIRDAFSELPCCLRSCCCSPTAPAKIVCPAQGALWVGLCIF